jgi:hemoglobin
MPDAEQGCSSMGNPIHYLLPDRYRRLDIKMACEFFCAGSGGPEIYTGKDLRAAHKGMNISRQEYLGVMEDIVGALDENRVDEDTKKDVIAILYSLKGGIIRV